MRWKPNNEEVASELIDGEVVLIHLSTGTYYNLEGAAALAWQGLAGELSQDAITTLLAERYELEPGSVAADLGEFVRQLEDEGLVLPSQADGDRPIELAPVVKGETYSPPRLNTYRDMGDLLALDPPMPGLTQVPWEGASAP